MFAANCYRVSCKTWKSRLTIHHTFPLEWEEGCIGLGKGKVDLRGSVPLARHMHRFAISVPQSTASRARNPDKPQLRATILAMIEQGMSYRAIGAVLGIHWTRVGQVVKCR